MVWCYILASMSNVLQHQHESFSTTYDIILNFKNMFGDQDRAASQIAMKDLMNTIMVEKARVSDHVLKMIGLLRDPWS